MSDNTFGRLFTVSTFGESHGPAMGCTISGMPPGMPLSLDDIQNELNLRRPGQSRYTSQRQEPDVVEILSGVYEGVTTGCAIGLLIRNVDAKSKDYTALKDQFRPGHADYTFQKKYGVRDHRGGGRASARETVNWVAAGAIAKKYLALQLGIQIEAYLAQMGPLVLDPIDIAHASQNEFFSPDPTKLSALADLIETVRKAQDSIGAAICVQARNVPVGLGAPVFHKLDAELAYAMMGIPGAKGVEIGDGFQVVTQNGSQHRDALTQNGFKSVHSGGILGGISTGQTIQLRVAMKPTSSIPQGIESIDIHGNACVVECKGRHDPCIGIRAVPVASALMAIVLMDSVMCDRAQNRSQMRNEHER